MKIDNQRNSGPISMKNIGDGNGEFKAILESDLSDGAKLAAIAELLGANGAVEIAKVLNKSIRTVERHYAELRKVRKCAGTQKCGTQNCGNTQKCVEKPAELRSPTTQNCVESSHACADITTRATKELPSEVSLFEEDITPSSVPPKLKTKPSRGTRLPSDWALPDDWRQWARLSFVHATDAMVTAEADQFRDFWIAKTGQGATKLDWQATWRNWCRNSKTLARIANPKPFNSGRMAYDEKIARIAGLRERMRQRAEGIMQ